jgi:hypothetical protein
MLDALRLAADAYERAEASLSAHGDDPTLRREFQTAHDTLINAVYRLSFDFPIRILAVPDVPCVILIYGLGDGREVGLQMLMSKKPDRSYRSQAKKWRKERGISQTQLAWEALDAFLAEDATVPGHLFGTIKYIVHVWRKR